MAVFIVDLQKDNIKQSISRAMHCAGRLEIIPGQEIIIKPNLMSAIWDKIYTNLDILKAVCEYFQENYETNKIVIVETDTLVGDAEDVFESLELTNFTNTMGIELLNAVHDSRVEINDPRLFNKKFYLSERVMKGARVNLCLMKPYNSVSRYLKRVGMSCALKNFFGLIAEKNKYKYHGASDSNLPKIIIDVNRTIPPAVILAEHGNKLLCSTNPVELDAIAAKLSGINPLKIEYLNMAKQLGLGENNPEKIEVCI